MVQNSKIKSAIYSERESSCEKRNPANLPRKLGLYQSFRKNNVIIEDAKASCFIMFFWLYFFCLLE